MQSSGRIIVSIFLFTSVLATSQLTNMKLRRDGVLNLYPFPRVGRSSPQTWQVPFKDLFLDIEYKPTEKRQLYAFPRVGRNDLSLLHKNRLHMEALPLPKPLREQLPSSFEEYLLSRSHGAKRSGESATNSDNMWFGPRLGRSYSYKDSEEETNQNDIAEQIDQDQAEPERVKRQTENQHQ